MLNSYTLSQIEQFKRDAKRLARKDSLSHSQSLDEVAVSLGHLNWSQLMKHSAATVQNADATPGHRPPYRFFRTAEEMQQAMSKTTPEPGAGTSANRLRAQVADLCPAFVSAHSAIDSAIAYVECALSVRRYLVNGRSLAYYEMRCWLPYCIHAVAGDLHILVGRDYKPIGMVQSEERVDYAAFSQAHFRMSEQQLRDCTIFRRHPEAGYLYEIGPWTSRADARNYLEKLKGLRDSLNTNRPKEEGRRMDPTRKIEIAGALERHYVHGDQYEKDPGKFYCAHCDLMVEEEHFEREHPGRAEERYFRSLNGWQRNVASGEARMHRPADARNALAALAAAQRGAREQARSAFHRWVEGQTRRNDPVGDLAGDIMRDRGFPTSASSLASVRAYLSGKARHRDVIKAFNTAWTEFEASN